LTKKAQQNHLFSSNSAFVIRIDVIFERDKFSSASWSNGTSIQDEPDLILENGLHEHLSSGGNYKRALKNKDYTYILDNSSICALNDCGFHLAIVKDQREVSYCNERISVYNTVKIAALILRIHPFYLLLNFIVL
jgi:hypothetical protein